jgi:hypothetical protein
MADSGIDPDTGDTVFGYKFDSDQVEGAKQAIEEYFAGAIGERA